MTKNADITITENDGWLEDDRGNRNRISYWGSREAAETALRSLKNCDNCTNCSDCSRCSGCSGCSGCSDCLDCSDCSRCSGCSGCSRCSGCSGCSDCLDCSDCSRCSGCSGCSDCLDCSDCSRCSGCSGCSDCSDCSDCSGCSGVAWQYDKQNMVAAEAGSTAGAAPGVPPIPVIPDIHKVIYEAVSRPKALNMGAWHTCDTTHCRAGWVVHKAGEAGYALEAFHNTELAAMLIYRESGYPINPARFHDSDKVAMDDMRRLAEGEGEPVQ